MPPVVAAVISIGASVAASFVASAVVKALIVIAASLAVTLLSKKPKNTNKLNQGAELRTKIDPTMPRQVMAGLCGTGGSCHFTYTSTNDSKKPNRFLYRVIQISDQPINNLVRVVVGKEVITFDGDVTTGWRAATQYRAKNGAACAWMRVYKGSFSATADATLVSETGGLWTASHKGTGLAYAIIKLDNDADAFPNGEPEFTFHVEGAKCYDDRKDSTRPGGSGTHRLNDYSTWEYSDTTSVVTAQFLRGFYINGVRIIGVGAEDRDLSTSMLFSAHNTCESTVEVEEGMEKRYATGMILNAAEAAAEILEDLQSAMDGKIYDRGGAITLLPGANRTPVMNLSDQDIVWSAEKSWQPKASLEAMLNCVTANYIDSANFFQEADLPVLKNAQWELDDGGERFSTFFSFRAVNKRSQGQRITKRLHQSSRYTGTCAFVGGLWLLEMEQGDWFTLSSQRWSFSSKYFEIQDITLTRDMRVAIIGREVHPNIDSWDWAEDEVPRSDTTWNPPDYDLPLPDIFVLPYKTENATTGLQTFNLDVGLVDPERYGGFVRSIEVELQRTGDTSISSVGAFTVDQQKLAITGLAPASDYTIRARTTDGKRGGEWTDWAPVSTDAPVRIIAGQLDYIDGATRIPMQDLMPAEPDATNSGSPSSPFGPDKTVGEVLLELDAAGDAIGDLDEYINNAQIEINDLDRRAREQAAKHADAALALIKTALDARNTHQMVTDAGIYIDPTTGRVRIYAVDAQGERIATTEIRLDAQSAQINLKAEYTWVNEQIALAAFDPTIIADLEDIFVRLGAAEIAIDGIEASIALLATSAELDALALTVSSALVDIDALQAQIVLKADQTVVDGIEVRLGTAETTISAFGDMSSISQTLYQMRYIGNNTAEATIKGLLAQHEAGKTTRVQLAYARTDIYTRITEDNAAVAGQLLQLLVQINGVSASLVQESSVRAAADSATTSSLSVLTATVSALDAELATEVARLDLAVATETSARAAAIAGLSAEIASVESDLTASLNTVEEAIVDLETGKASVTSVNALAVEVDSVQAELLTVATVLATTEGIVNAMWALRLTVGNKISGIVSENDGELASFRIAADYTSIEDPDTGKVFLEATDNELRLNDVEIKIVGVGGTMMKVTGVGFGSTNQFQEWFGPYFANLSSCTEANAIYYLKTNGSATFKAEQFQIAASSGGGISVVGRTLFVHNASAEEVVRLGTWED